MFVNVCVCFEDGGWDFVDGEMNEMARDVVGRGGEEEDGYGDGVYFGASGEFLIKFYVGKIGFFDVVD